MLLRARDLYLQEPSQPAAFDAARLKNLYAATIPRPAEVLQPLSRDALLRQSMLQDASMVDLEASLARPGKLSHAGGDSLA